MGVCVLRAAAACEDFHSSLVAESRLLGRPQSVLAQVVIYDGKTTPMLMRKERKKERINATG